jgi:hypothetical protein
MRDLTKLLFPFPSAVVDRNPSGYGTYVAHPIVEQRLLDVLGPVNTELVEVLRGYVAPAKDHPEPLQNAIVGVVLCMSAEIDGRRVHVEEVGDCEAPHNWPHDGARMKDAFSDAYKRCAMRLGVGLHLWVKNPDQNYYISKKLLKQDEGVDTETGEVPA